MITKFDKYGNKRYWLVPTDNRFVTSLNKLGCDKSFIEYQRKNDNIKLHKYVYVGTGNRVSNNEWSWAGYSEEGKNAFENLNYTYMGTINMEDYELNIDKYNL